MLSGSVFSSRPNKRNNPNALFTSLVHQLTTKIDAYANDLGLLIERDPTLVAKSIREQFQELLIRPLQKLQSDGKEIKQLVLIVALVDSAPACGVCGHGCPIHW